LVGGDLYGGLGKEPPEKITTDMCGSLTNQGSEGLAWGGNFSMPKREGPERDSQAPQGTGATGPPEKKRYRGKEGFSHERKKTEGPHGKEK